MEPENPYPPAGHDLSKEELVEAVCGNCHLTPDPGLFTVTEWQQRILPNMGRRLGIRVPGRDPMNQSTMMDAFILRSNGVYPDDTLIAIEDWQKLQEFYTTLAPQQIPSPPPMDSTIFDLPGFKITPINTLPADPSSSLVRFDTTKGTILWGSTNGDLMEVQPASGKVVRQLELPQMVSDWVRYEGEDYFSALGITGLMEEPQGWLVKSKAYNQEVILKELQRPYRFKITDLDASGTADFVVSETGYQTGKLMWYQDQDSTLVGRIIKKAPGFVDLEILDYDEDGRLDIVALQTHGDERVSVFYNDPGQLFKEQILLQLPAVYGSSSFSLVDFNGDGLMDILHTAGEPSTYEAPPRSYHGVRIFLNDGEQFNEELFLPFFGARKALAGDFDNDGDYDIIAISFHPDFTQKSPLGFIYFQNQGDLKFTRYSFEEMIEGRWFDLDVADVDADGDLDAVIGSYLQRPAQGTESLRDLWMQQSHHMIYLENTTN